MSTTTETASRGPVEIQYGTYHWHTGTDPYDPAAVEALAARLTLDAARACVGCETGLLPGEDVYCEPCADLLAAEADGADVR